MTGFIIQAKLLWQMFAQFNKATRWCNTQLTHYMTVEECNELGTLLTETAESLEGNFQLRFVTTPFDLLLSLNSGKVIYSPSKKFALHVHQNNISILTGPILSLVERLS